MFRAPNEDEYTFSDFFSLIFEGIVMAEVGESWVGVSMRLVLPVIMEELLAYKSVEVVA
jgi:hypothetical protein